MARYHVYMTMCKPIKTYKNVDRSQVEFAGSEAMCFSFLGNNIRL